MLEWLVRQKDILEAATYVAALIGIPVGFFVYLRQKREERRRHEIETHQYANDLYTTYLYRCLDEPELEAFEFRSNDKAVLECGLKYKQLIMFTILISMMETAYLRYRHVHDEAQSTQWRGWKEFIVEWTEREDFRRAWHLVGPQFDTEFVKHMRATIAGSKIRTPEETLQ